MAKVKVRRVKPYSGYNGKTPDKLLLDAGVLFKNFHVGTDTYKSANIIMPIVSQLVQTVLPVFQQIFEAIMPLIDNLAKTILPIIVELFQELSPVIQFLSTVFGSVLGEAIKNIVTLLQPLFDILNGIITFIGGVFAGDWEKVWEGIVEIFKGILNGLMVFFENMINGVFWIINGLLDGINWAIEWTGLEIPHIEDVHLPRFRAGIDYVPNDKFLAYLDAGEAVLTASEAEEYRKAKRESGTGSPFRTDRDEANTKTISQTFSFNITVERLDSDTDIDELAEQVSERIASAVRQTEGVYA